MTIETVPASFAIDRGAPTIYTIAIEGVDLSIAGTDWHGSIRQKPDALGDPTVDLPKVGSATETGIRLVGTDTTGVLPTSYLRVQIPAMATGVAAGQLPPAPTPGGSLTFAWDCFVQLPGLTADKWFAGMVTIKPTCTKPATPFTLEDDPAPAADLAVALNSADLTLTIESASAVALLVGQSQGALAETQTARDLASVAAAQALAAQAAALNTVAQSYTDKVLNITGLALPKRPTWISASGRLRRAATGWQKTVANDVRYYFSADGAFQGLLMESADTIRSGPWDSGDGTSAIALTKSIAADTVAYAGTHAAHDLFGTTGKGVLWTKGGSTSSRLYPTTLRSACNSGDVVRTRATIHVTATAGAAPTYQLSARHDSGTLAANVTATFDASGNFVSYAVAGGALTRQSANSGGCDLLDTLPTGEKVYSLWVDGTATAALTGVAPQIASTGVAGTAAMVHAMDHSINPATLRPSVLPVYEDKLFVADTLALGSGLVPLEAEFETLCVGRTYIADGKVSAPTFRSSLPLPVEKRINIKPTAETSNLDYILPSPRWEKDAWAAQAGMDRTVVLGPGRYTFTAGIGTSPQPTGLMGTYTLKGAFADPKRWPMVRRFEARNSHVTSLVIKNVALFGWASTGTSVNEGAASTNVVFFSPLTLTMDRFVVRGCPISHSRSYAEAKWWPTDPQALNALQFGSFTTERLASGFNWSLTNGEMLNLNYGPNFLQLNKTDTGTAYIEGVYSHHITVDHYDTSVGTVKYTWKNCVFGPCTDPIASGYQSQASIEVDIGNGRQTLAAAGVSTAALPINRPFSLYGTRATPTGDITVAPDINWRTRVFSFATSGQFSKNVDGYQFIAAVPYYSASAADGDIDDTANLPFQMENANSVWVFTGDGPASPANPHIFVTMQFGQYAADGTYNAGTGAPAASQARLHPDAIQVNGSSAGAVVDFTVTGCLFFNHHQNMSLGGTSSGNGLTTFSNFDVENNIVLTGTYNAMAIYTIPGAGTIKNTIIIPAKPQLITSQGQTFPWFSFSGAGVNIALTNCWAAQSDGPSTLSAGFRAYNGAVVSGDGQPKYYAAPWHETPSVVHPETVLPALPAFRNFIDRKYLQADGLPVPNEATMKAMRFTPVAERITGIALNSIKDTAWSYAHKDFGELRALMDRLSRTPDRSITISAAGTAADAVIFSGLKSGQLDRLYGGNTRDLFYLSSGQLKAKAALTGINDVFHLVTDQDEHLLVDVQ